MAQIVAFKRAHFFSLDNDIIDGTPRPLAAWAWLSTSPSPATPTAEPVNVGPPLTALPVPRSSPARRSRSISTD